MVLNKYEINGKAARLPAAKHNVINWEVYTVYHIRKHCNRLSKRSIAQLRHHYWHKTKQPNPQTAGKNY